MEEINGNPLSFIGHLLDKLSKLSSFFLTYGGHKYFKIGFININNYNINNYISYYYINFDEEYKLLSTHINIFINESIIFRDLSTEIENELLDE